MWKSLGFILCLAAASTAHAQIMEEWGWEKLDSSMLVCQYEYNQYDPIVDKKRQETILLEIGSSIVKCYSYETFEYDSLHSTPSGKKVLEERAADCFRRQARASSKEEGLRILLELPSRESEFMIYSHYPEKGKMLVQDAVSDDFYKYTETLPLQEWSMEEDTMYIVGYLCQKATCKWRGRQYTAWFAPDIPLGYGPYKFGGLPGLIMKVEDSKQRYSFQIKGIRQEQRGIFLAQPRNGTAYQDAERKEQIARKAKQIKNLIRAVNRDMQRIGNSSRVPSPKDSGVLELGFK